MFRGRAYPPRNSRDIFTDWTIKELVDTRMTSRKVRAHGRFMLDWHGRPQAGMTRETEH